jgi:hypothetical protein
MAEIVKKTSAKPKAAAKPRKTAAKSNGVPSNVTEMKPPIDQVAKLAHRFWAERGHKHGHHEEDWYRAEQELRGMAS